MKDTMVDDSFNFLQDLPVEQYTQKIIQPSKSEEDEPPDQILLDALANPRERMNCLKLEDIMLTFIKSQ